MTATINTLSKMKRPSLLAMLVLTVVFGCNNQPQIIEITPVILISVPQKSKIAIADSEKSQKKWEVVFGDDHFAVFRYPITNQDSANVIDQKMAFKKNIDAFIQVFDFKNLDSTFTYKDEFSECDLSFDYSGSTGNYRFYGRFLANKQDFIAFCFQTPFPVDNYSKKTKDKLFNSIDLE